MAYCLALLSADRYVPVDLMVEKMSVSIVDGTLKVHEVYDVIFTPSTRWEDARILVLSPHRLCEGAQLNAKVSITPGTRGPDNDFYNDMVLCEASLDAGTEMFSVTLPAHSGPYDTSVCKYVAKVLEPALEIPRRIAESPAACQIMQEFGTVFELSCGTLEAGKSYAIRLILDPLELLALAEKRPLDDRKIDEIVSRWIQDATIICPKTAYFNFVKLVSGARSRLEAPEPNSTIAQSQLEAAIDGVNRLLGVVKNDTLTYMPIRRQQIVLVLPAGAELATRSADGYVWFTDTYVLADGKVAVVWEAGSEQFWRDDPEEIARIICEYFRKYANVPQGAKTKEEASAAIDALHENCALIMDVLCREGALAALDGGKYVIAKKTQEETFRICQTVAASAEIATRFTWKGFQVRYALQHRYLSKEDARLLKRTRNRRKLSYFLAIAGVVLGAISLVLSVIGIVYAMRP